MTLHKANSSSIKRETRGATVRGRTLRTRSKSLPSPVQFSSAPSQVSAPTSIALLSTYPPRECGLATFTAALYTHLVNSDAAFSRRVGVIRVLGGGESADDKSGAVVGYLVNGSHTSARANVRMLNSYDSVIIQHEYGIYGGPDGEDILGIVESITVPTIVVLHTVLVDPTAHQRDILNRLAAAADIVVTMTETGRTRLEQLYGVAPNRIAVIPHGAIDHNATLHEPRRANVRPVVLTWGLLGPGKGIEWAIDAMVGLRDLNPRYRIVGKTHPKVLERDGERYRGGLVDRANRRGVSDLIEFDAHYLSVQQLAVLVQSADVVLLPYDSPDQVTSGVLIEAIAAGRPVVSTAFPHAVELLANGSGIVVPQRDSNAIRDAVRRILSEPALAKSMAGHAAASAPALVWGAVAQRYCHLVDSLAEGRNSATRSSVAGEHAAARAVQS